MAHHVDEARRDRLSAGVELETPAAGGTSPDVGDAITVNRELAYGAPPEPS
jgi:hypothetical protein